MKLRNLKSVFPALALPLLASAAMAQMTGTAHPDELSDGTPVQTDHYVKPSHAGDANAPAPIVQAAPGYADSYPATGPTPVLIPRQPAGEANRNLPPTPATGDGMSAPMVRQPVETAYSPAIADGSLQPVTEDVRSGVVVDIPRQPHQLIDGTLLKARLQQTIATQTTAAGTFFSAELLEDVGHGGEVMLPAGSILRGRVAAIHGGKRIGGQASIRLQPKTVTLPDGTSYALVADVVNVNGMDDTRVNEEGSIRLKSHAKETVAAVGLSTVSAMAAGAVIGGGVGAAVGASLGAGVATVVWLKQDHQETLPAGTSLTFALGEPLTVSPR